MGNLIKTIFEIFLIIIFIWFVLISYVWIKANGIGDTNSMIAIATMVYAFFTFFMFWNMKSSSETQVRPFLVTNFDDELNLHLTNKIEKNPAKDVKIRVRAMPIKYFKKDSKYARFLHKYLFARVWASIWDYFSSYRQNYEIFNGFTKIDLSEYIKSKIPIIKKTSKWGDTIVESKLKEEIVFKLLILISYDSLLDITYDLYDKYIIRIKDNKTKIEKII